MKRYTSKTVLIFVCVACVACQSAPKTKPLTEMTDDEKRAVYMYGPISAPQEEHKGISKALVVTGEILLLIPMGYLLGMAAASQQVHTSK